LSLEFDAKVRHYCRRGDWLSLIRRREVDDDARAGQKMAPHGGVVLAAFVLLAPVGCGGAAAKTDAQLQQEIVSKMQGLVLGELRGLKQAALDLQAAAPSSLARGWDPSQDGGLALAAMKEAWTRTRRYWEHVEGPLAPMFPDLDRSIDSRYEDMLGQAGGAPDPDPFDGQGDTGMHAVERVLFAPGPMEVVAYESTLGGYQPAAWPASDQAAADFKSGLCQRLVDDAQLLLDGWQSRAIDLGVVFTGLTGLISAQAEKVSLAAAHQQESRYSQTTMVDLRSNLEGSRAVYELFVPWLATKPYGTSLDVNATQAFDVLDQAYGAVVGDAIPPPPASWGPPPHSVEDLQSPFGALYVTVVQEVDPTRPGSAVDAMNHVARALGLPELMGQS
jgi:iron uptake system component EfeO